MKLKPFFLALAAAALLIPGAAQAAVTTSNITSPGDPTFLIDDDDAPVEATLTVTGTSNGTTGDLVDIRCHHSGTSETLVEDIAVAADGSFGGSGEIDNIDNNACYLRAVPDGFTGQTPTRFAGPRVLVSEKETLEVSGGPNDGRVTDLDLDAEHLTGYWNFGSATGGGITDGAPYGIPSYNDEAGGWNTGAGLEQTDGSGFRSQVQVDGRDAYGPQAATELFPDSEDNAGLPALTFTFTQNAQTGDSTITESSPLVRCPDATYPPTAVSCPSFVPTGVRIDRTWVVTVGGRMARMSDQIVSTDGAAHAVDLLYESDADESETGWIVPPDTEYNRYNDVRVPGGQLPAGPFSIMAKEKDDEPDGSLEAGIGGLTFAEKPDYIDWTGEQEIEAHYVRQVGAGGTAAVQFTYTQAFTQKQINALTEIAEDLYRGESCAGRRPTIFARPGRAVVGTAGVDVVQGTRGSDEIRTFGGNDVICSGGGNDLVRSGGGADRVNTGAGLDNIDSSGGADRVLAGEGRDVAKGGGGADQLRGGLGNDRLLGGNGNDRLFGGKGTDSLLGAAGNDRLLGGDGSDRCKGGRGRNTTRSC